MTERERLLFSSLMGLIGAIVLAGVLAHEGVAAIVAVFGSMSLIGVTFGTRPRPYEPPASAYRVPRAPDSARALLEQRLAMGEIDTDEFLERDSALRDAAHH
jgi:uncharacterized membrane protein